MDYKQCPRCRRVFPSLGFFKNRRQYDGLSSYCRDCHRETYTNSTARAIRERIIVALGSRCRECGYDRDIRALQVDHIKNDGRAHRDRSAGNGPRYYLAIEKDAMHTVQVLCANCHAIKTAEHHRHFVKKKAPQPAPLAGPELEAFLSSRRDPQSKHCRSSSS